MNKVSKLLAPCVSILCLIHCVGMALLSVLAPTLMIFEHSELVEASVVLINLVFGNWSLYNMNKPRKYYFWLNTLIAIATISILQHQDSMLHLTILSMAFLQIKTLWDHKRSKKVKCCDHNH